MTVAAILEDKAKAQFAGKRRAFTSVHCLMYLTPSGNYAMSGTPGARPPDAA